MPAYELVPTIEVQLGGDRWPQIPTSDRERGGDHDPPVIGCPHGRRIDAYHVPAVGTPAEPAGGVLAGFLAHARNRRSGERKAHPYSTTRAPRPCQSARPEPSRFRTVSHRGSQASAHRRRDLPPSGAIGVQGSWEAGGLRDPILHPLP